MGSFTYQAVVLLHCRLLNLCLIKRKLLLKSAQLLELFFNLFHGWPFLPIQLYAFLVILATAKISSSLPSFTTCLSTISRGDFVSSRIENDLHDFCSDLPGEMACSPGRSSASTTPKAYISLFSVN